MCRIKVVWRHRELIGDDCLGDIRQRHDVRALVLAPLGRKLDGTVGDFAAAKIGNLTPSLAGQDQQLDDAARNVVARSKPD